MSHKILEPARHDRCNLSCIEPKSAAMNARAASEEKRVTQGALNQFAWRREIRSALSSYTWAGDGAARGGSEKSRMQVNEWMNGWRCVLDCAIYHLTLCEGASVGWLAFCIRHTERWRGGPNWTMVLESAKNRWRDAQPKIIPERLCSPRVHSKRSHLVLLC